MRKFWNELFKTPRTKIALSTAYHSETDGQSEIANRKIKEMIRGFLNYRKDICDDNLVEFEVAYNSAVNSTTLYTPFFLSYRINSKSITIETISSSNSSVSEFIRNIQEAKNFAIQQIYIRNEAMALYANKHRIPQNISVNDLVWLFTKNLSLENRTSIRKLHPEFCGSFKSVRKVSNVSFKFELSVPMKHWKIYDTLYVSFP